MYTLRLFCIDNCKKCKKWEFICDALELSYEKSNPEIDDSLSDRYNVESYPYIHIVDNNGNEVFVVKDELKYFNLYKKAVEFGIK